MTQQTTIYQLDNAPTLQNRVFDSVAEAKSSPTGDIRIVQSAESGLIYNSSFDAGRLTYDKNYNNEQSLSQSFQSHLKNVQEIILEHLGKQELLEVGCGKAYFLQMLRSQQFDIIGCDPTYEGSDPGIIKDFYHPGIGISHKNIVLRHVLEHISDPISFLQSLNATNRGGKIYIEVPCVEWIAKQGAWFDIFYEHVNYFRLSDLQASFGKVFDSGRIFGNQYLYIVADLATIQRPRRLPEDTFEFPATFKPEFSHIQPGVMNVVWGAASKGVIYSLLATRNGQSIAFAIDVNPAKQGKFLPLSGIRVLSPDEATEQLPTNSNILIMNSNYASEIIKMSGGRYTYTMVDNAK